MQTATRNIFTTITTEGALLPADLLEQIGQGAPGIEGLSPQDYELAPTERLGEATSRSWNRLQGLWATFQPALAVLPAGDPATTVTRERWLLPLFQELGFGRLPVARAQEIGGKTYPISHMWEQVPVHLVGAGVSIDRRSAGVSGAARTSPHSLLQEFLNRSEDQLWGVVSNGLRLRILRDNSSLTRQAYVEFDLAAMMDGQLYADFVLLWLVCHKTRFQADKPVHCRLEQWSHTAADNGTRALDQLRNGVEAAISALGRGYLSHADNRALRERLRSAELSDQDYYRQLLRMVYRLIFIFVAEDRDLLLAPDATPEARTRYTKYYSTSRLRHLAVRQRGTRHSDLYHSLRLVMRMLGEDEGCQDLGLPALNSFLFEGGGGGSMPDLDSAQISNHDLLEAIRELAYVVEGNVRRPVSYRSLGSEELGSVYEALLELHPVVNVGAGQFDLTTAAGNERKTTGSYYTPSSLINSLLDSALDPVLEEAARKPTPEQAILNLKVCDPACGSGHFLVAAAHRMAKRLASVRTGDDEPSPEAVRKALRDVIGRCIYGVDINPMSVELCTVSLWMEALEPGKPLSFLQHHIKVGNSLLGTTPRLMQGGIPDEVFEPITGDEKAVCSEYKKRNKEFRKGQQYLFDVDTGAAWDHLGNLPVAMASLNDIDDSTVEGVHARQERYTELVRSQGYIYGQLLADAWCAAFVWRKNADFAYPIWEKVYRDIERSPFNIAPWMREEIQRLAGQYDFFHWHLAFPDVFLVPGKDERPTNEQMGSTGGFDVVLGNPPWEHTELKEKEWFATRRMDIADAQTGAQRKLMIERLGIEDPDLHAAFRDELRSHEGLSHFVSHCGRYPLCGRGRINTYAVFAEAMLSLLSPVGRAGIVIPSGIATDDTTKFFFQSLMDNGSLVSLYHFDNRLRLFPAVGSMITFCLLTVTGSLRLHKLGATFAFFAQRVEDLGDDERRFTLTAPDIVLLNPNTRTCPIFRSRRDAELTKAIYRQVPVLIAEGLDGYQQNPWGIRFKQGLFNMTIDSGLFRTREQLEADDWRLENNIFRKAGKQYLPLYEAKMIHHFTHRWATYEGLDTREMASLELADPYRSALPRYWVPAIEVETRLAGRWDRGWLLGFRDICRSTDERTVIATILPKVGVGHTTPIMILQPSSSWLAACLLANLTSCLLDYIARQKVGGIHLTYSYLNQFPILPPETYFRDVPWRSGGSLRDWLAPRVLELVFTTWDLEPFARDLGYSGAPFGWDEERRFRLRCELDAAYFHLYGIGRDNADYVLETFPIVRRKDEARYGEYRTKRVILEIYDAMQRAIGTNQTPLDQPPVLGAHLPEPPQSHNTTSVPPSVDRWPVSATSAQAEGHSIATSATPVVPALAAPSSIQQQSPPPNPRPLAGGGDGAAEAPQEGRIARSSTPSLDFRTGDRVKHHVFGEGQVLQIAVSGEDQIVTVQFGVAGRRRLSARASKLEKA